MYYFAIFLSSGTFAEKCLALIKFISNPNSRSLPHITLRLFRSSQGRLDNIRKKCIDSLNIIGPGTFNMEESAKSYVVFLQCESKELEFLEHKPNYPLSRLHITLYDGDDFEYAKAVYEVLRKFEWKFALTFLEPIRLSEEQLGHKNVNNFDFKTAFEEIVGEDFESFQTTRHDPASRLRVIEIILKRLHDYNCCHGAKKVSSLYSTVEEMFSSDLFIDQSQRSIIQINDEQLRLDSFMSDAEKPVQDAIYVTPPECAEDMAICALNAFADDSKEIDFGDSAIGTGTLFLALQHLIDHTNTTEGKHYTFRSAVGVDNDRVMAREAFVKCSKRGLKVILGDAVSPGIDLGPKRNLMVVNPPYNRYQDIPESYRKQLYKLVKEQTGIQVTGDAGLYVYHLLIMDKWLSDDGIAVWLLPTIFLQTRYGSAVRDYLLNHVQLLRLHIYDERTPQFDDIMISTTIVVFRKSVPNGNIKVAISTGDSIENPDYINADILRSKDQNWRSLISTLADLPLSYKSGHNAPQFQMLFEIKRGLATGANADFVLNRNKAKAYGIPDIAVKPILPKARYLKSLTIESEPDGYPAVDPQLVLIDCDLPYEEIREKYPGFYQYLCSAEKKGITERTLVKSRKPWYKQEKREPPPFLLTYMGRNKKDVPPLYFVLNKSKAVALNTYILLYPRPWLKELLEKDNDLYDKLLTSLNTSAASILRRQTRIYSGGLQKMEPNELKESPIIALPDIILEKLSDG